MEFDFTTIWTQLQDTFVNLVNSLPSFLLAMLVLILFFVLAGRVSLWMKSFVRNRSHSQNAATVIALITRWGIIALGVLVALSIALPSFEAGDLIQILGISSVAIGFAFRDIFQNFLAGLIILVTDAFKIGDQIIVESEDLEGTVTDIQTRATTIVTYDDRQIIIPNATLFTNAVTINTASEKRRSEQVVGIGYDSDIDTACRLIQEAVSEIDGVSSDPAPDVLVDDLAGSSVNLRVRWWTDARRSNVTTIKSAVVRRIKYLLNEHDIDIPFPRRTL
jgi:small conductance mechanosensitive channel